MAGYLEHVAQYSAKVRAQIMRQRSRAVVRARQEPEVEECGRLAYDLVVLHGE